MMRKPLTDQQQSISSAELVWDSSDSAAVHDLVLPSLLERLRTAWARTVLDLGCGNGSLSARVQAAGFEVTGLEHSKSGIEMASKAFPAVRFQQHDIANPLPTEHAGQYDAVISVDVIEHPLIPRKLTDAAIQALKPGGVLFLTTPYHGYLKNLALALTNEFDDHWHPLRDYGHVKFFSQSTLRSLFEEYGLAQIHVGQLGRIPPLACSISMSGVKN